MLLNCGAGEDENETPVFWPPDAKSQLTGKDPDAGKDWGQEKKTTENEMVGWYHWLKGHEQTLGDSEEQGSLGAAIHGVARRQTWFSNWTTTKLVINITIGQS